MIFEAGDLASKRDRLRSSSEFASENQFGIGIQFDDFQFNARVFRRAKNLPSTPPPANAFRDSNGLSTKAFYKLLVE